MESQECQHEWQEENDLRAGISSEYCIYCNKVRNIHKIPPREIITRIQAWQACNCDGTPARYKKGTPEGDRWLTQKLTIYPDGTERYTNFW